MYRFLFTPRWLGILALTLTAAAVMVLAGNWQLSRYQARSAINARIDAAAARPPVPLSEALPAAGDGPGAVGPPPATDTEYARVTVTGRYDSANVILVRGRTVESRVGFEVLTPLLLADGSAVLVDRGWLPPAPGGAAAQPEMPATPTGEVTVMGRIRLSESRLGGVTRSEARIVTRRIALPELAGELPYPTYGAYLLLDEQNPAADPAFRPIPIRHENDWQNAGYVLQWWVFALMTLAAFGWLVRREAHGGVPGAATAERVPTDRAALDEAVTGGAPAAQDDGVTA